MAVINAARPYRPGTDTAAQAKRRSAGLLSSNSAILRVSLLKLSTAKPLITQGVNARRPRQLVAARGLRLHNGSRKKIMKNKRGIPDFDPRYLADLQRRPEQTDTHAWEQIKDVFSWLGVVIFFFGIVALIIVALFEAFA